ncbi:hypothetical protein F4553_000757 [Allocatelliglobosispora scoriae]|uniref:Uncharacterized protein n=1 Tax=Allocatelliglobosispora scoriae TaxID=643052 RepID=A0A841BJ77_9ACTN|nr:hypothetical protein [Allocatelliglobosispora scoriae]MBB5867378.1 hypothetical protein [Allocatelliglobosispora scoriae]
MKRKPIIAASLALLLLPLVAVAADLVVVPGRLKPSAEALDDDGGEVGAAGWRTSRDTEKAPAAAWPAPARNRLQLAAGQRKQAGKTPVWLKAAAASTVDVEVIDRAAVPANWRDGLLIRLDGSPGTADLTVDYAAFRGAAGGDWASRLRLWTVPSCALTTPSAAECRATPLATTNSPADSTASATVGLKSLVALSAGPSGSGGDFAASPMQPSSTWAAGSSAGDFTWNYPLRMSPSSGPLPAVALAYSSAGVDGRSEATNNQPSWAGEGFEYSPGFIERRYVPCAEDQANGGNNSQKTGDLCWRSDNATMSLNGSGGELVFETGQGWHNRKDDGSKIEKLTGSGNGDDNGEYWKVTTSDGVQYFFGRHSLPGQSTVTESALTVPVYGNHLNEPCRQASFAASSCVQAWRWNLDYVVDTFGNTMSYWYDKELNKYAKNNTDTDDVVYSRGSVLKRIDYGTYYRTLAEHGVNEISVTPVKQVLFGVADRCFTNCTSGGQPVKASWKDTPLDQDCSLTATECPGKYTPTFWSTKRLAVVTTQTWDTTKTTPAWQPVDSWTFTHSFPPTGDVTNAGIWLDSIVHTGLVGTAIAMPPVTFEPVAMPNRVLTPASTTNNWHRITNIITETGAKVHVDYSLPECTAANVVALQPHTNTMRCYPVLMPDYSANPNGSVLKTEWWHKYVVTHVTELDVPITGGQGATPKHTYYEYLDGPAWRYADDDGMSKPERRTWSQYRGYATVKTRTGDDPATQTLQVTKYMLGMHQDRANPAGALRSVTVPAQRGQRGRVRRGPVRRNGSGADRLQRRRDQAGLQDGQRPLEFGRDGVAHDRRADDQREVHRDADDLYRYRPGGGRGRRVADHQDHAGNGPDIRHRELVGKPRRHQRKQRREVHHPHL